MSWLASRCVIMCTPTLPMASFSSRRIPRKLPRVKPPAKAAEQCQSLRCFMTSPMANNQMLISNMPNSGARIFMPQDTEKVRMVEKVATHTSARKMYNGSEPLERNTDRPPYRPRRAISIRKQRCGCKSKKRFCVLSSEEEELLLRRMEDSGFRTDFLLASRRAAGYAPRRRKITVWRRRYDCYPSLYGNAGHTGIPSRLRGTYGPDRR